MCRRWHIIVANRRFTLYSLQWNMRNKVCNQPFLLDLEACYHYHRLCDSTPLLPTPWQCHENVDVIVNIELAIGIEWRKYTDTIGGGLATLWHFLWIFHLQRLWSIMAKTTRSSSGKAKKAAATKAKPAKKSVSPKKKESSSGGAVVSIEACKQVRWNLCIWCVHLRQLLYYMIYLTLGLLILFLSLSFYTY